MSRMVPEGWEKKPLSTLADYHNGRAFKPEDWSSEGLPIVRIAQINNPQQDTDSYNGSDVLEKHKIRKGDLIFSWSATLKAIIWKDYDAVLNQHLFKVIEKDGISRRYLQQLIDFSIDELAESSHGSTMKHIKKGVLDEFKCAIPPLPEQQKIASILTSVDKAIEKTQSQINKLQDLKKGTMNELLTRGIGHTEFKDSPMGRIPKEWDVVKLDRIATIQTGAAKSSKLTGDLIELPYLRVANVQDGYLDLTEIKTIKIPRNRSKRYLLRENDVLVNEGGDFDKLGRGSIWHSQVSPCIHQNHVFVVRTEGSKLNPKFFNHLSGSEHGKKYYMGCAKQTTNLASINSTQLKQFPVLLPTITEQNSICEVLDSFDKKLSTMQRKHTKYVALKKALMQVLLTGKVRVTVN